MKQEGRARRRIRQAVELYGYRLVWLEYEPIGPGAEKAGPSGGWFGDVEGPNGREDHAVMGYGVEHALDWIDEFLKPVEPCGDVWTTENALARQRAQVQTHGPDCRYHLTYSLPWFRERPA